MDLPLGEVRIIPAYAGSTRPLRRGLSHCPDHPRIRGEHFDRSVWAVRAEGSSPHTRGAPVEGASVLPPLRIIPAYAGSTAAPRSHSPARRDHPRIRGEHDPSTGMSLQQMGSSPHTRGARSGPPARRRGSRIIPAYAGSTVPEQHGEVCGQDHPRIRGEHACG